MTKEEARDTVRKFMRIYVKITDDAFNLDPSFIEAREVLGGSRCDEVMTLWKEVKDELEGTAK